MRDGTPFLKPLRVLAVFLAVSVWAAPALSQPIGLDLVDGLLEDSQFDRAEELLMRLEEQVGETPQTLYLRSRVLFFRGEYDLSLDAI
ncbi:MAG: hypothetical protein KC561_15630, partial [Myxococcales bacterium]|nr:hypothetical protein [Myxococcales bacterium]